MDPKDLRIGNYIQQDGKVVQVQSVSNDGIGYFHFETQASNKEELFHADENGKGIPLTEKWLLKLGFEDIGGDDYERTFVYKDNRRIKIKAHQPDLIHLEIANNYWGQIQFVHNLQNLYHALIAEDLVAKL